MFPGRPSSAWSPRGHHDARQFLSDRAAGSAGKWYLFVAALTQSASTYQLMLGAFSAALLLFGIWWSPLIEWTRASLVFLQRG
jgi:hypothetical protein